MPRLERKVESDMGKDFEKNYLTTAHGIDLSKEKDKLESQRHLVNSPVEKP